MIGNGPEIGAQILPGANSGVVAGYGDIIRRFAALKKIIQEALGKGRNPSQTRIVDLIRRIRWPVIVIVTAGENAQHWNVFWVKGGDVSGQVRVILQREIEACGNVALFDQASPGAAGTGSL